MLLPALWAAAGKVISISRAAPFGLRPPTALGPLDVAAMGTPVADRRSARVVQIIDGRGGVLGRGGHKPDTAFSTAASLRNLSAGGRRLKFGFPRGARR